MGSPSGCSASKKARRSSSLGGWKRPTGVVDVDEVDAHRDPAQQLDQRRSVVGAAVDAADDHVLERHALAGHRRVLAHRVDELVDGPGLLRRGMSERRRCRVAPVSEIARRKGCRSAVKRRISGTTPAVEMVMARPLMAPPDGSAKMRAARDDVVVVEERLAHAHEDDAAHRAIGLVADDAQLLDDLPGGEVAA